MQFYTRTDPEFVHQVQDEMYRQRRAKDLRVVKLPCGCASVQVASPSHDLIALRCPRCHRTHYMIWSAIGNHAWRK